VNTAGQKPEQASTTLFRWASVLPPVASDQITIPDFDYEATDDDRMRVDATVKNEGDSERTVTLTVQVRAGEDRYEQSTTVEVGSNESAETETVFDTTVEEFEGDGSINFDWETE
jgi:hypothetical protein